MVVCDLVLVEDAVSRQREHHREVGVHDRGPLSPVQDVQPPVVQERAQHLELDFVLLPRSGREHPPLAHLPLALCHEVLDGPLELLYEGLLPEPSVPRMLPVAISILLQPLIGREVLPLPLGARRFRAPVAHRAAPVAVSPDGSFGSLPPRRGGAPRRRRYLRLDSRKVRWVRGRRLGRRHPGLPVFTVHVRQHVPFFVGDVRPEPKDFGAGHRHEGVHALAHGPQAEGVGAVAGVRPVFPIQPAQQIPEVAHVLHGGYGRRRKATRRFLRHVPRSRSKLEPQQGAPSLELARPRSARLCASDAPSALGAPRAAS
mmetsp:Transcript_4762/g.19065  ORF Transcript_4762/g.19065 Transcript_4762/m.19065 type:complete len:315 (+) Transcript_4762:1392-2336(+)